MKNILTMRIPWYVIPSALVLFIGALLGIRAFTPVFSATPTTGSAPLTVSFVTSASKDPGGDEYMDYGDGSKDSARGAADPNETHTFSHTYAKPGTYVATFYAKYIVSPDDPSIGNLHTGTESGMLKVSRPLGSQTITVQ
jgi:hypothetical protein